MKRRHGQARRLPAAPHTDAAHRAITGHLRLQTLQCRGGGPVPHQLVLPAAIVLAAVALSLLAILLPTLGRLLTWR